MTGILPKQKVSKSERDLQWYKDNANYRIDESNYWSGDRWEMIMLYKAASGDLDPTYYKHVLNPYNSADENLSRYPAAMRNLDIIIPILNSFLGEKANRPFNHKTVVANPDSPNSTKDAQDNDFMRALAQHFVNNLNENGFQTGVATQEVPPYQKILEHYSLSDTTDDRAIFGQEALNYIKYDLNLKDKYQEAFYDWLVTGRVYTYKDVYKNDLLYEIVPPLELWHGTTRTGFIEDADWVVRRTRFNLSNVIDRYHEVLSPEEISDLEDKFRNGNSNGATVTLFTTGSPNIDKAANANSNNSITSTSDLIDIWHIVWKGFEKVGILKYIDELGQEQETEVSEEYKLSPENGDIDIEWQYKGKTYEVHRIGEDLFKYARPILAQREELANSSVTKLPYNGRVGYNERTVVNSTVKQAVPYQALYNTFHFRRELILARNKDKIMLMPIGLIPDDFGNDAEGMSKYLHFIETTGLAFFDETKENALQVLNAIKAIDLSLGQYVIGMTELIRSIKEEMWDAVGMNRQRYGDVNSSDGKGVNDQAIFRSAVITREMNRRFERFQETDLQGLIEYSKLAWINGKKGMYITSDGHRAFLEVNPERHLDTEYGVFVVDGQEEEENLQKGKEYAFAWAQKSTLPAGIVIDVLNTKNMSALSDKVKRAEKLQREYEDSIRQSEQQNAQILQDKVNQDNDLERQKDITVAEIQAGGNVTAAQIRAESAGKTSEGEEVDKTDEVYKAYINKISKAEAAKREAGAKVLNTIGKDRYKEADLALKEKKMENDMKIAKANKNRYDK